MISQLREVGCGVMGKWGDGVMGKWGDGVMGKWGDGVMGKWGSGVMGKWGDGEVGCGVVTACALRGEVGRINKNNLLNTEY